MRRFFERLLNLLRVRQPDRDLAREIDAHLALLQDTLRGSRPVAGRRAARRTAGSGKRRQCQGAASGRTVLSLDRRRLAGCRARAPPAAAQPHLHRDRGAVTGDRHRREHRDLHGGQRPPLSSARRHHRSIRARRHRVGPRRWRREPGQPRALSRNRAPHDFTGERVRGRDVPARHGHGALGDRKC